MVLQKKWCLVPIDWTRASTPVTLEPIFSNARTKLTQSKKVFVASVAKSLLDLNKKDSNTTIESRKD